MGILFDAVQIKAEKGITPAMIRIGSVIGAAMAVEPKIRQGAVTMVALDEITPFTEEQYGCLLERRNRTGEYMREDPAHTTKRKEQIDHESQN